VVALWGEMRIGEEGDRGAQVCLNRGSMSASNTHEYMHGALDISTDGVPTNLIWYDNSNNNNNNDITVIIIIIIIIIVIIKLDKNTGMNMFQNQ
jgi:hypothetical protein